MDKNTIDGIAGAVYFVVGILVLIKLFQKGGLVQGIIGLITCNLYTFFWGWRNAKKENIGGLMWIWTGVFVLSVVVAIVAGMSGGAPAGGGGGADPTAVPTEGLLIIRTLLHM